MWNSGSGYPGNNPPYPPPGGFGNAPSFPSAGGFGGGFDGGFGGGFGMMEQTPPPFHSGYAPAYAPPQGLPPGGFPNPGGFQGGYPPPDSNDPFQIPSPSYPSPSMPPPGQYPSPIGLPPNQNQLPPGPPGQHQPHPGPPGQHQPHPSPLGYDQHKPPPGPLGYDQHKPPPGPPNHNQYQTPSGPPPQPGKQGPGPPPIQHDGGYPGSNAYKPPPGPPSQGPPSVPGNRPNNPPSSDTPHMPPFERQFAGAQGHQFDYQYSKCNGKKKALCIGINYRGQQAELKGCINDALNVKRFLITTYDYKDADIVMLTDDSSNPRQIPNAKNIRDAMKWLVRDAKPNDSLFFHFSGHGGQTKDHDGDEADGHDEVIYPVDFKVAGHIVDDEMHEIMVKPLPAGCRLTAIFDCCHSGSSLDLPYMYSTEGKIKEPNVAADIGQGLLGIASSYSKKDMGGLLKGGLGILKAASGGAQKASEHQKRTRTSAADVISWSGCKDSQTSADTVEAGKATGAMSYAFISVLTKNKGKNITYHQLLNEIRNILKNNYSQKPQLAASHPIETNSYFLC